MVLRPGWLPAVLAAALAGTHAVASAEGGSAGPGGCGSDPCYGPRGFDCPMRQMALDYANFTLSAGANLAAVAAALNISACRAELHSSASTPTTVLRRPPPQPSSGGVAAATIVVATTGSDTTGDGSLTKPFATVHRAQAAARLVGKGAVVSIRAGTYYLPKPLELTERDSGSSYVNHPGEQPILSGGEPLKGLSWSRWKPAPDITEQRQRQHAQQQQQVAPAQCGMIITNHTACTRDPFKSIHTESLDDCCAACGAAGCNSFTFAPSSGSCRMSALGLDKCYKTTPGSGLVCGSMSTLPPSPEPCPSPHPGPSPPGPPSPTPAPAADAWVAELPAGTAQINSLFLGNQRQWRARWPNGSPEKANDGYSMDGTTTGSVSLNDTISLPGNVNVYCKEDGTQQPPRLVASGVMPDLPKGSAATTHNFTVPCATIPATGAPDDWLRAVGDSAGSGYGPLSHPGTYQGGALERFTPPISFWQSTVPNGLKGIARASLKNWSNPAAGLFVNAYHPQSWGNWGFKVDKFADGIMSFTQNSGNQEARGGGQAMGARYFSGMLEELDAAREFHHDLATAKLYWAPPATPGQEETKETGKGVSLPPSADGLVVPRLDRLIQVAGSSAATPAKDIVLSGLTLMHSAPTFCCDHPYESISGGDWSLHRGAAVFFENATDSTMSGCLLDHPEGNGIILNGYTERLAITRNEVASSGDSSVLAVGVARFMDGRSNSHPRNNTISHNHLHHWGVWGKQSSAYFGGIAREQHVLHNVIHDGPRAGINQNDGFAGGHEFAYNLVLNTVLDTGDHGNFNSWDRKPWVWLQDSANPSSLRMVPQQSTIHNNFIIRTSFLGPSKNLYCIDHDDGSSMYNDTDNFLVYGGIKFREGLSKHAGGNYMCYPNGPDAREVPFADQCKGSNNSYTGNTVIAHAGQFYGACAAYKTTDPADHVDIDFNTYYSANASFDDGGCGAADGLSWSDWQHAGLGQDRHSTLRDSARLSWAAMLAAGRAKLSF